jgi:ATP citrate (pro-S)-lyase
MSAKAINEYSGKRLLAKWLTNSPSLSSYSNPVSFLPSTKLAFVSGMSPLDESFANIEIQEPWVLSERLVVKPDQLIKRRGKLGLIGINLDWNGVKEWISQRYKKTISIDGVSGVLKSFLIEPFVPHAQETEHYVCIQSQRDGDLIYFYDKGGIDVGDVDAKAKKLLIPIDGDIKSLNIRSSLLTESLSEQTKTVLEDFIIRLYSVYVDLNFTYFEINPLVVIPQSPTPLVVYLDVAAKLDQTAEFESGKYWIVDNNNISFPAPFGRELTKEEAYIQELDAKTGASLKLTVLNPNGRIWTMVAGGGASVVYSDAICSLGFANELANYGEYSGAPSETQTFEYAKTILDLMTRGNVLEKGKVLIIGGGIANFTNVATTFKGIVRGLKEYKDKLAQHKVSIFVRRGGPNYSEGLRQMREIGDVIGVPIHVYGPETHITAIIPMALGLQKISKKGTNSIISDKLMNTSPEDKRNDAFEIIKRDESIVRFTEQPSTPHPWFCPFTEETRAFIYGMQPRAIQGMLDFDQLCKRKVPSVVGMIYPFGGSHVQKFYWGDKETLLPVFTCIKDAISKFPTVDTVVNFASMRSVYESTMELMEYPSIKNIAIIAEGVPERRTRQIIKESRKKNVLIIGPATVGGIKPGCFKIGNTGGMIDNIIGSKLYRPGSVGYVSKSGGMSNELNNLLNIYSNGVYEGVAIGGDRYPGTTFIDHLLRFEGDPKCKILVLLGEVGGVEEYEVVKALEAGLIKKPLIAWCIGTCAGLFGAEVQFGHAGALANSNLETSKVKNDALRKAGAYVPETFEEFPVILGQVYSDLITNGVIIPSVEPETPKIPIDYSWAQELGLIRKPASFVSTICDDRGQELLYAGMPISKVFDEEIGIGGVLSLLWFKRRLPGYACKFIEMVLMLTADHGPAVSGAHNTIVTARAGKDLISSLVSGLLTIGDRFGGALDGAAEQFGSAYEKGLSPKEFVESMRRQHKHILGIGHKIKSRSNPDLRVTILTNYAKESFPCTPTLDFAREVESITTAKKENLILNVDGAVAVLFVDLLKYSGAFSREEAEEYIKIGTLNGLFVLGRSVGFIGHYLDQKRLKQGLYRHPWDDINYAVEGESTVMVDSKSLS